MIAWAWETAYPGLASRRLKNGVCRFVDLWHGEGRYAVTDKRELLIVMWFCS